MKVSSIDMKGARLGQHFLTSRQPAVALLRAVGVKKGETILEIGPGKGALTSVLLSSGNKVLAVEKDEVLVARLHETFADEIANDVLKIVEQDIRDFDPGSWKLTAGSYVLAANIPYYITGEIIRQFLTSKIQPRAMALLVQKEVARRIVDTKESILSLSVKVYGKPKIIQTVSRKLFSPPPQVDSAILLVDDISKKFFDDITEEQFFSVVRTGFASKRKFLANNLGTVFGKENVLAALAQCGISEKARAEDVPLEQWKQLTARLAIEQ